MRSLQTEDDKPIQEKCGIIAVYNKTRSASLPIALTAAGGVQHRGQQGAGVALQFRKDIISYMGNGLLKEVFTPKIVEKLNKSTTWILVHCRYGTHGGYDKRNLQPCIVTSKEGTKIAIVHNGEFVANEQMRRQLSAKFPPDISDTYLFAQLLADMEGLTWEHRVIHALSQAKGAYSLMIGVENKLFVARDELGLRPLVIGQLKDKWIVASETHALDKIGAITVREVKKGEIIRIDTNGLSVIKRGVESSRHFCEFEWAYFSRPDSLLPTHEHPEDGIHPKDWLSVSNFRERCGIVLAEESPLPRATFVVGVPDSGISVATGYANNLKLPYRQAIIRDHHDANGNQRLFMRDDQMKRIRKKVLGKLSIIGDSRIWKGASVVISDDSIVRGNVTAQITKAIFLMGAKEVHWLIGFPPVTHPCYLGVSIRTREELIAANHNADPRRIAKKIGATSVNYISHRGFIKARLLSNTVKIPADLKDIFLLNGGCGGCLTGHYPISRDGAIRSLTS